MEAAFFDLDKTLMAGSSGMHFARVASRHGIVSRRQLARWGLDHLRYRLRGASDEETKEVLQVARELITGVPAVEIDRMGAEVLASILPRIYPQMLDELYAHQDADRPTFIVSAAGNDLVSALARVLGADAGIGTRYEVDAQGKFTGRLDGPFVYREGKVDAMRRFAEQHGIDLDASYAYSRLRLGPADAARRRASGGRQPRLRAGGGRRAGGLGRDAVREARAPIGDRRHQRSPPPRSAASRVGWPPAALPAGAFRPGPCGARPRLLGTPKKETLMARIDPPSRLGLAATASRWYARRRYGSDLAPTAVWAHRTGLMLGYRRDVDCQQVMALRRR